MADVAAGEAVTLARLPQGDRARVAQVEQRAFLVRMRLLRAAIDAMAAEEALTRAQKDCRRGTVSEGGRLSPPPPPPPPPVQLCLPPPCPEAVSILS
eukprot:6640860-Pyramimonas_sp.AAC.1